MSKEDWQSLKELKNDESIAIKEVDKGVVIMDSAHYKHIIYKQLGDKKTCKKVDPFCDNKTRRAKNSIVRKSKNSFLKQEIGCLTSFQHESSNFYGLPKIDKSKLVSKAIEDQVPEYISCFQPKYLKLHPIVAGPKCSTKRLSNFVLKILF